MFPEEFLERLKHIVPAKKYEQVLSAMSSPRATSFRVNTLRATREHVLKALAEEGIEVNAIGWYEEGYWVSHVQREALLASAPYEAQEIYVQNQSSMIPPLILAPKPGQKVLDLTAAPGSKTLQIACMMDQEGEIAAVEVVRERFFKLRNNLQSQGATEVRTFLKDGRSVWRHRPEYFDCVLLDAPCSSEGRFQAELPDTFAYWSKRKIKDMAHKQKRLLQSAIQCLKPGGTLVYSTCSFSPEENESIITGAMKRHKEALEILTCPIDLENFAPGKTSWNGTEYLPDVTKARRILPTYQMDGFFVCKIVKKDSTLSMKK